jgi:hypothetical protein
VPDHVIEPLPRTVLSFGPGQRNDLRKTPDDLAGPVAGSIITADDLKRHGALLCHNGV